MPVCCICTRCWLTSGLLSNGLVLGLVYLGIRLFGDERMLGRLDAFEARLLIAWERLQLFLASF